MKVDDFLEGTGEALWGCKMLGIGSSDSLPLFILTGESAGILSIGWLLFAGELGHESKVIGVV